MRIVDVLGDDREANLNSVQSHKRLREMNKNTGGSSQDCSICIGPIAVSRIFLLQQSI